MAGAFFGWADVIRTLIGTYIGRVIRRSISDGLSKFLCLSLSLTQIIINALHSRLQFLCNFL